MNWLRELVRRLSMLTHRRQFDADLEEEMRLHIELRHQEHVLAGMSPDDARTAARRRFGNATYLKEESHLAWNWEWLENLAQDVRYGLRILRRSPGFSAVCILTIALGIGATTAIFSVVDATLLHPLPYPQPEQLVRLKDDLPGLGVQDVGMSEPEWQDLQRSGIFEYVSPAWFDENNLTGPFQPARIRLLIVAPNYFALLGVAPQLGHAFHPEDYTPGLEQDVVISDGMWKRTFGGEPNVLNKNVRLDTDLYRIVGVMPAGFRSPGRRTEERNIDVWVATSFYGAPMADHPPRNRRNLPEAIARLKPGLTIPAAQSRLDALVASLQKQFPGDYPSQSAWTVRMVPLKQSVVGGARQSLVLLLGTVGLVLLIACVNVANLVLARGSAREREMAVRQALGATPRRLVSQLLTENLLLFLIGGMLGIAVLFCTEGFLLRLLPDSLPRMNEVSLNLAVLLFALSVSLIAGAIFGLAPALHAGRLDLAPALKEAARGSTGSADRRRRRSLLVIIEFSLSLVLLVAAGLLLRSFWELLNVQLGFNPQNILAVRTRLPYPNNPETDKYGTAAQEAPFLREILRRGRTLPGVEEMALGDTASIPLDRSQRELKLVSEGRFFLSFEGHDVQSDQPTAVERSSVTPDYFHLLGIPLLRGRVFNESDNAKAPQVAVINEAFAKTYWPGQNPLGKHFKKTGSGSAWITVVGEIANARTESLVEPSVPKIYLDLYQTGSKHLAILLRGRLDAAAIAEAVREQVHSVNPTLPVFGAQTLNETISMSLSERRFSLEMVALFALAALLLAGLGIYGVISYFVGSRTHEIGIRLALGARRWSIVRMVLRQGLRLAVAGAGAGFIGALIVSHVLAGMLYGVAPTDPLTFAGVALLLIGVALLASYVPARRAMRVDPMAALRHE